MADRKSARTAPPARPELDALLEAAKHRKLSDAELQEQRVSFVYGNAPVDSAITRESARRAAETMHLSE